jgi:DNA invertase Pin-like site-specific DNA recombinase
MEKFNNKLIIMKRTKFPRKTIAYLRVSTETQDTAKNKLDILNFANNKDFGKVQFVEEHASGTKSWKNRKLQDIVQTLQKGDVLIVPELSRLGRSLIDVLDILKVLTDKDVRVYSVKENFQLNGADMQSKMMRTMLTLFAEIERDLISLRTKEGLQRAREKGRVGGRPRGVGRSKLDKHRDEIIQLIKNGSQRQFIAKRFHCTPANLLHWLKNHNLDTLKAQP